MNSESMNPSLEQPKVNRPSRHILLVEDNEHDAKAVQRTLLREGEEWIVTHCQRGTEALELLLDSGSMFDAILCDFQLPDISGLELQQQIRDKGLDTPLVLVTGMGTEEVAARALRLQAQDYVIKDTSKDYLSQLPKSLSKVIDNHKGKVALRQSESRFRMAVSHTSLGICLINYDGIIQLFNPAAQSIFNYTADEVVGKDINTLVPGPDDNSQGDFIQDFLKLENPQGDSAGWETKGKRKNGDMFPLQIGFGLMRVDDQDLYVLSLNDLTFFKSMEAKIVQSQKLEATGRLAGGIAHDFNNLLCSILGNAQLMRRKSTDEVDQDRLDSIIKASDKAGTLVNQMLSFSRKQHLNPELINVGELCNRMHPLLSGTVGEAMQIELKREDRSLVCVDSKQLETAILHLVINSRDAMDSRGRIIIHTKEFIVSQNDKVGPSNLSAGGYVMLTVTDIGKGILPEIIENVFDPFFTTKGVGEGTGLGLSMVHGFAKQSGGDITIESAVDKGTSVTVYLPVSQNQAERKEPRPIIDDVPTGHGETVLVVEDQTELRALILEQLDVLGYKPIEARDGSAGLDLLSSSLKIDALLADVVLPGSLSGLELYDKAQTLRPNLKILFMSGYSANNINSRIPSDTQFLAKPFSVEELAFALRRTLDD